MITVGPVTTRMAPIWWAAKAAIAQVSGPAYMMIRRTAVEVSRISRKFSVRPPSNRMIATAIDTIGR